MAISMLKIRRPLGRLIFNMWIAIPGKTVFLIETAPRASAAIALVYPERSHFNIKSVNIQPYQSGRSPKVVALFSATNFSSYIIKLLQLHDKIQIEWNYAWIHYNIAIGRHLML